MESVIQINSDDNIDKLLEKASIFNKNEEQENIKFLIFHYLSNSNLDLPNLNVALLKRHFLICLKNPLQVTHHY